MLPLFFGPRGLFLTEDFDFLGKNLADDFFNPPWAMKVATTVRLATWKAFHGERYLETQLTFDLLRAVHVY